MAAEVTRRRDRRSQRSLRRARGSAVMAVVMVLAWLVLPMTAQAATVQQPDTTIILRGEGTDYADLLTVALDGLAGSSEAAPRFDFIGSNEAEGLRSFVEGRSEFYVGALPLDEVIPGTTAELAKDRGSITAPFQATGAVPFMSGPYGAGLRWCASGLVTNLETLDISCPDAGGTVPLSSVRTGAPGDSVRLYPENLVQLFTQSLPTDFWFDPNFASQAAPDGCQRDVDGACLQKIDLPGVPGPVSGVRTDNAAVNKFMQQYLKMLSPSDFRNRVLSDIPDAQRDSYVITTRWPRSAQPSRSPDDNLAGTVQTWANFQSSEIPKGGAVALVHPLKAKRAIELERSGPAPVTDLWIADYVHQGQVVSGTPQAITAAIAAGGTTPFYAATNTVQGAWPLSWVDNITFPARGLSVDQTNAAALLIRLQMTAGQAKAAELADGKLPASLVAQALDAANQVVASNCLAAKGTVVKEVGAGPYTPKDLGPVLAALGSVSWCQATAATPEPPPTTTPEAPGTQEFQDVLAFAGFSVDDTGAPFIASDAGFSPLAETLPEAAVVPEAAPVAPADTTPPTDAAAAGKEDESVEAIAANMPLDLPGTTTRGMDRLATIALGAAIFFGARALWRSGMLHRAAGVGA